MGYVFMALALTAGIVKSYCAKKTSGYTHEWRDAMLASLLRLALCVVFGFAFVCIGDGASALIPTAPLLLIASLSGIFTAAFLVLWLLSVKRGVYMMVEVFVMLGVLIPMVLSAVFFDEAVYINDRIGIAALVLAALVMCSYNNTQKQAITPTSLLLLVACGICAGMADFSQKLFVHVLPQDSIAAFNLYTYIVATLALCPSLWLRSSGTIVRSSNDQAKVIPYIAVMSVCLFANSYCKTRAAIYLDAARLYPVNQGVALVLSALMAAVLFHERITWRCVVGLLIAFVGLLCINVM